MKKLQKEIEDIDRREKEEMNKYQMLMDENDQKMKIELDNLENNIKEEKRINEKKIKEKFEKLLEDNKKDLSFLEKVHNNRINELRNELNNLS